MSISMKQSLIFFFILLTRALLHESSNLHAVFKKMKAWFIFTKDIFFLLIHSWYDFFSPLSCFFSRFCGWLLSLHLFVLCSCQPHPHLQLVQWMMNILVLLMLSVSGYFLFFKRSHSAQNIQKITKLWLAMDLQGLFDSSRRKKYSLVSQWRQITANVSKVKIRKTQNDYLHML